MATARITINQAQLRQFLASPAGPVVRHVEKLTRRVANEARRQAPVDEGTLRASIQQAVTVTGTKVVGRVGSGLDYALYVHQGTGIYGPKGKPIVPIRRQYLRFEVKSGKLAKGKRPVVFAKSVKGSPPKPFLVDALKKVSPYPVRVLRQS